MAHDITDLGTKLYDNMKAENELKQHREKTLQFLDSISNIDSNNEQGMIENKVKEIISQQNDQISEMSQYVQRLEKD